MQAAIDGITPGFYKDWQFFPIFVLYNYRNVRYQN